jgi:hypothetical protein
VNLIIPRLNQSNKVAIGARKRTEVRDTDQKDIVIYFSCFGTERVEEGKT